MKYSSAFALLMVPFLFAATSALAEDDANAVFNTAVAEVTDGVDDAVSPANDPNAYGMSQIVNDQNAAVEPVEKTKKVAKISKKKDPEAREIPLIETDNDVVSSPEIAFVTGGVGEDERAEMEAAKAQYNVHVMSAAASGAFVGDAQIVIARKKGKALEQMLSMVAGPLLYVQLPAGQYVLDASLGEQKQHRVLTVNKKGAVNITLNWKTSAVTSK